MIPLPRMTMNASKKKLLKHIFKNTEITRGELVKSTGLSNLTVTKLVAEMLEQSLIIEDGVIKGRALAKHKPPKDAEKKSSQQQEQSGLPKGAEIQIDG